MTYEELSAQLVILTDDDAVGASPRLLTATNLALSELYSAHAVLKTVRLGARGVKPLLYHRQIVAENGRAVEFEIEGHAYSFRIQGSCQVVITNTSGMQSFSVESGVEAKTVKGIIPKGSKMTLFGSFTFTIYDFSVYGQMFSLEEADIPEPGNKAVFDLRRIFGDFMSFYTPAEDGAGNRLEGCRLYDGRVEIDSHYNGEIQITYRRLPTLCLGDVPEEVVDVPGEYAQVLPLLIASYLLSDSDEKLAAYYKSKYDEITAMIDGGGYRAIDSSYELKGGWT